MGFYANRIVPRLINITCGQAQLRPLRRRAAAGLYGHIVEIGFGSGLNVPVYPMTVTSVTAVDPSGVGWELAADRVAASSIPIERTGAGSAASGPNGTGAGSAASGPNRTGAASGPDLTGAGLGGQRLPFADDTFDGALSTFTMCTIPDLPAALAELRRVLKPDASLHFLEHGHAPDASVQRWQRRLEPIQRRLFDGCHLTRDIPAALRTAGFTVTELDTFYQEGTPRAFGALSLGAAAAGHVPGA